jgi:hypothetical protein
MTDIEEARLGVIRRVLEGDGLASRAQRRATFDDADLAEPLQTLVHNVATQSWKMTDREIAAVRAAGHSEDQIFEFVVCAAVGQANRQYETAMAALEAATNGNNHAPGDSR